jgi:hypothetical protein
VNLFKNLTKIYINNLDKEVIKEMKEESEKNEEMV